MFVSSPSSMPGHVLAAMALMLPWLNPIAAGPTPSVLPWLVSAACVAGLCALAAHADIRWTATIRASWLWAALISSVLGLLQYFDLSAALDGWVNNPAPGVAYGNLRQRNQFA
ncbi:MAG: polymerase, partial [Rhodoferax sp.]|nr:polymerase [Rhodoferax sp.]